MIDKNPDRKYIYYFIYIISKIGYVILLPEESTLNDLHLFCTYIIRQIKVPIAEQVPMNRTVLQYSCLYKIENVLL